MTHRIRSPFAVLCFIALIALPSLATAQQPREHDGGILIRLSAGVGAAASELEFDTGDKLETGKAGGNHNFAIGGVVGGNVALHATLFGWAVSDPTIELNGVEVANFKGTASLNAIGGGATWYFMPINMYLSGSLAFAWLSFKDDNVSVDSGMGGALDLTFGKEWWVSDRWGLGVALGLQAYGIPADNADAFKGGAVALRFSATFN